MRYEQTQLWKGVLEVVAGLFDPVGVILLYLVIQLILVVIIVT